MSLDEADLSPAAGFVADELREEFPGLRLDWVTAPGRRGRSAPPIARRLLELSSRYRGASVVAMRTQPVPQAYRTFFRQIGLDPDTDRIPSEQMAVERLLVGGFRPRERLEDALQLALIETGVPVWALDADVVDPGGLGVRIARNGDRLGPHPLGPALEAGRLVVADAARIHGLLFGPVVPEHEVTAASERVTLFSVGVDGVPAIHIEEALWICLEALGAA
jgi:DNA/RNA-binding domain of Phe-tRNA-synthetase-like protein